MQLSFSVTEVEPNQLELVPESKSVTEVINPDIPALDTINYERYNRRGDFRNDPNAVSVITLGTGEVVTHFARPYTKAEMLAIAEFESNFDI
jgi:hypothetical protein